MFAEIFAIIGYDFNNQPVTKSLGLVRYKDNMIDTSYNYPQLNKLGWEYTEKVLGIRRIDVESYSPNFVIKLNISVFKDMYKIKKSKYEQFLNDYYGK